MKFVKILLLVFAFALSSTAQTIHKADKTPSNLNDSQVSMLREGIRKHDEGKFDDAISYFQGVLDNCSDCVLATFEIANSYYGKKDYSNALKYLEEASRYKGSTLPKVYRLIGSIVDDQGDRKKALEFFQKALKLDPNDEVAHYDMGVTFARLNRLDEAKKSLKKSIEIRPNYVSPHYILSEVFLGTKYRIPAMFAAARVLSLETDTARSNRANKIFMDIFQGNVTKGDKPGSLNIFLNMNSPTDEGDFGSIELILGLSGAVEETGDDKNKSDEEKFISSLNTLIAVAGEIKMKSNFVKDQYFSFMTDLKKQGHVESFAYLILQQQGNKKAETWILDNGQKMLDFVKWSREFKPE